ncbi:MAG: hypothetical protein AABZ55_08700 [Bdellovibrionota bacterium]
MDCSKFALMDLPNWLNAISSLLLAIIAIFHEPIRSRLSAPKLKATILSAAPDCVSVPVSLNKNESANAFYLRLRIENLVSNCFFNRAVAKNVEVFAEKLEKKNVNGGWDDVSSFPPMNLKWANRPQHEIYSPAIAPGMWRHCDLGHIVDPEFKAKAGEFNQKLLNNADKVSLAFDLVVSPNHRGHIVGPGEYRLNVVISSENAQPKNSTIRIFISGEWKPEESEMFNKEVAVSII